MSARGQHGIRQRAWGAAGLAALLGTLAGAAGCSDGGSEPFYGPVVYDGMPPEAAGEDLSEDFGIAHAFVLQVGAADDALVQFASFGSLNPALPPMYIMTRGGVPVAGQYPIIDTLPGGEGYSSFWQVIEVEVDDDYRPNAIKSVEGLRDAGLPRQPRTAAVHCPVVNPDASWITADFSALLTVFWGTGEEIPNPAFDPASPAGADNAPTLDEPDADVGLLDDGSLLLQPVWHKRLLGFCWTESLERRYPTTTDDDGLVVLDDAAFSDRFEQIGFDDSACEPEQGEADPCDNERQDLSYYLPWGTAPVFSAGLGDADDSPARRLFWVITETGDQLTSAAAINPDDAILIDLVDNALLLPFAPPEE